MNRPEMIIGQNGPARLRRAVRSHLEVTVMRDLSILLAVAVVLILVFQTQRKHR
ncbi:hypothetical protein [Phyllobacterium bourgognense]|uniref:Uncharacterized protein n=1 Tax=Phyllobacterium bourgognense TaxID=314236 RepID=A0A368Z033_9HYPH|nr:hypothetical protein [Phyllobacterium bourgognense]RCW85168.1 hypothetical protein C7476_1038 [Phyllobacterium bourgognense]